MEYNFAEVWFRETRTVRETEETDQQDAEEEFKMLAPVTDDGYHQYWSNAVGLPYVTENSGSIIAIAAT